jgi:hypothetical protein
MSAWSSLKLPISPNAGSRRLLKWLQLRSWRSLSTTAARHVESNDPKHKLDIIRKIQKDLKDDQNHEAVQIRKIRKDLEDDHYSALRNKISRVSGHIENFRKTHARRDAPFKYQKALDRGAFVRKIPLNVPASGVELDEQREGPLGLGKYEQATMERAAKAGQELEQANRGREVTYADPASLKPQSSLFATKDAFGSSGTTKDARIFRHSGDVMAARRKYEECKDSCSKHITNIPFEWAGASATPIKISSAKLICSYNLDDEKNLYVPGKAARHIHLEYPLTIRLGAPPRYTKYQVPFSLEGETDEPVSPLDPEAHFHEHIHHALAALSRMNPTFSFASISIAITFDALQELYSNFRNEGASTATKPFFMHKVRDTLFIDTPSSSFAKVRNYLPENGFYASATKLEHGMPASARHYRWIEYPIGDLRLAVLMEALAYWPDQKAKTKSMPKHKKYLSQITPHALEGEPLPSEHPGQVLYTTPNDPVPHEQVTTLRVVPRASPTYAKKLQYLMNRVQLLVDGTLALRKGKKNIMTLKTRELQSRPGTGWIEQRKAELAQIAAVLAELRRVARRNESNAFVAIMRSFAMSGGEEPGIDVFEAETDQRELARKGVQEAGRVHRLGLSEDVVDRFWTEEGRKDLRKFERQAKVLPMQIRAQIAAETQAPYTPTGPRTA